MLDTLPIAGVVDGRVRKTGFPIISWEEIAITEISGPRPKLSLWVVPPFKRSTSKRKTTRVFKRHLHSVALEMYMLGTACSWLLSGRGRLACCFAPDHQANPIRSTHRPYIFNNIRLRRDTPSVTSYCNAIECNNTVGCGGYYG